MRKREIEGLTKKQLMEVKDKIRRMANTGKTLNDIEDFLVYDVGLSPMYAYDITKSALRLRKVS
jgi:hypothetical protein